MTDSNEVITQKIESLLYIVAKAGLYHSIKGLSQMIGQEMTITDPEVTLVPIMEIPKLVGGMETEVAGIYLKTEGQMGGQFMLILPYEKALEMVDLLMYEPPGTTKEFDDLSRSALAEMGNLTGTFFLNGIAEMTGLETQPSPPAVMIDMVGAILNVIMATSAQTVEEVIMISTSIVHGEREAKADFWYVPDLDALKELDNLG